MDGKLLGYVSLKKEHLKEMMKDLIGARMGGEKEKLARGDLRRTRSSDFAASCSFTWADCFLIMSHTKMHLEQMMKELIDEAGS